MKTHALTGLLFAMGLVLRAAETASRWDELGMLARPLEAIEPTPTGEAHLGLVASGDAVQIRVPVPREAVAAYWLGLGNIVAYTGKGTSYQLVLHRDSPQGALLYTGPVIAAGDDWNAANRVPIDITGQVTAADRKRGCLDVYATGIVAGDGWTLYRHQRTRPVLAHAVVETEDMRRQVAAARAMQERGVAILPVPQQLELAEGTLVLPATSRLALAPGSPPRLTAAAEELRDVIAERTGVTLTVAAAAPAAGGIAIRLASATESASLQVPTESGGYVLRLDAEGAAVWGRDEAGCFYGAMTLGQMARPAPGGGVAFPRSHVRDWPAFPQRIIQYDVARGQTIDVGYVKRMIRELARCKVNGLLFYMEDDFQFRAYPFLGRPGTFTHAKARELTEFARRYGVQLIPQFEALGHAGAVLRHEELAALREAGDAWVFCTSEPQTWSFLDAVFGELVEAFPDAAYIHVGGDEFEPGFGKCERCKATVASRGIGALYADHMNRLNTLVKKRGRTMLFWPSHHGPTPELSEMTLKYQAQLEKDCIPTEWIYHGPAAYPTIEAYQQAGFRDVFCSPAVESYSRVWPDHITTFRAVQGFYRAGRDRGGGGAYCTTWEFMHGALWENSWYGLLFAAECSWNPSGTGRTEYTRRFADVWWGISAPEADVTADLESALFDPLPSSGPAALWHSGVYIRDLLWVGPDRTLREFALKRPEVAAQVEALRAAVARARERLEQAVPHLRRNVLTVRAARLGYSLIGYTADKLGGLQRAGAMYREAAAAAPEAHDAVATRLDAVRGILTGLQHQAAALAEEYGHFVDHCGAYAGDAERLKAQATEFGRLAMIVGAAQEARATSRTAPLPPAAEFGFLAGTYTRVGEWTPQQMREDKAVLRFDLAPFIKTDGPLTVEWEYMRGAHALAIYTTQVVCDGKVIAEDRHPGVTGAAHHGNTYRLDVKGVRPGAPLELVAETASRGGTDSSGTVWLLRSASPP